MKLKSLINYLIIFIFVSIITVYAGTSADRSSIVIDYQNFGWNGLNAGWMEDECLISPEFTLDYSLHSTNRNSAGAPQYVVAPVNAENWGEQVDNEFISNDNTCSLASTGGTQAEISEFWLTWDSEWIYCAVVGEMENTYQTSQDDQGNNLMVLFDRVRDFGIKDFISAPAVWNKKVYTRDFELDFYVGAYGGWGSFSTKSLGGIQFYDCNNPADQYADVQVALLQPANSSYSGATNRVAAFYNGDYEFDARERVLLFKIGIDLFTNSMASVSSITLKVMCLSVDGSDDKAGATYDFCPNNLAGMNSIDRKSVVDNYFLIPFTDAGGNVLTNVSPRYDAGIMYLPGSRNFMQPTFDILMFAHNSSTGIGYNRSIFVPQRDENMNLAVTIPKNANVFDASVAVYNMRGDLVGQLLEGAEWAAPVESSGTFSSSWDGRDANGDFVPMGTYIVVFTGITEDGLEWNQMKYVTVMH